MGRVHCEEAVPQAEQEGGPTKKSRLLLKLGVKTLQDKHHSRVSSRMLDTRDGLMGKVQETQIKTGGGTFFAQKQYIYSSVLQHKYIRSLILLSGH